MLSEIRLGKAWGSDLAVHWSWLPFAAAAVWLLTTWVTLGVALVSVLMWLGSALLHTLLRLWVAARHDVSPQRVTVFPLGFLTQPDRLVPAPSALRIGLAGVGGSLALTGLFGFLWRIEPGVLGLEMEFIAIYNLALALFTLLVQLTPRQPQALNAALALILAPDQLAWAWRVPRVARESLLVLAMVATVFVFELASWSGVATWLLLLVSLAEATSLATRRGAYQFAYSADIIPQLLPDSAAIAAEERQAA